ncbi:MAG: MBL fold metallo-hydrolase [Povalibacter sp.]
MSNDSSSGSSITSSTPGISTAGVATPSVTTPGVTAEGENWASGPERLAYHETAAPEFGSASSLVPGVHWTRIPLPIDLNHINVWLLHTSDGCIVVDTGMAWEGGKDAWQLLARNFLLTSPVRAVFVTHIHPDHIGLAGWLQQELRVPVWMSRRTYEQAEQILGGKYLANADEAESFFRTHGLDDVTTLRPMFSPGRLARLASGLPHVERFVEEGDALPIADGWLAMETNGHAEGHLCLWHRERDLLISGDQVLPTISSNIGYSWRNTDRNPLHSFLTSLHRLSALPRATLVLPSHGQPFKGLQQRTEDLIQHHTQQLDVVLRACIEPQTAAQIVPLLFRRRPLFGMHLFLALAEALAHLEYLAQLARLEKTGDSVIRYRTIA